MLTKFAAGLLAGLLPLLAHADVYKWVDAEGRTHYSNVPPKNVKIRRVEGGGVTVVPALVIPPVPAFSAPAAQPAMSEPPVAVSAPATGEPEAKGGVSPQRPATASAAASSKNTYDVPASEPVVDEFKPMPGWSQPPIRPRNNMNATPAGEASAPAARNKKNGSAPALSSESRGGGSAITPPGTPKQD